MSRKIDLEELERLTRLGWRTADIADKLGVRRQYVHFMRVKHGLTRPGRKPPDHSPSVQDDVASGDSLALSPWVAARIKELGLGVFA